MLLPSEPKRLYGCSGGLTAVQLRDAGRNRTLDTVIDIEVLPIPSISGHTQVAYRWLNITWAPGHSDYTSFTIEWRKKTDTEWNALSETPAGTGDADRSRAIVSGYSADIRGLPFSSSVARDNIVVRVVGHVGDRTATSAGYGITRSKPNAVGHQHDHAIGYNLSGLGDSKLEGWLRNAAPDAATAWATAISYLSAHAGNEVDLELYDGTKKCPGQTACVKYGIDKNREDPGFSLPSTMTMIFYPNPVYNGNPYKWTNNKSLNMFPADGGKHTYGWVELWSMSSGTRLA